MITGLQGRVAVVTGGASGIGQACVQLLEEAGATVHVVDRAATPSIDVTDRAALEQLADSLRERHGGLDILVNAAGIVTENRPFEEIPPEELGRNLDVNLVGTFNTCQILGPLLWGRQGAIVNISSQAGLYALPSQAAYSASKGAVVALTRCLAIDWGGRGVRVNAVAPGAVVTPMTAEFFANEQLVEWLSRRTPLGRLLQPEEVAGAIVFLASPLASAITGVVLEVNGGWTAGEPALAW